MLWELFFKYYEFLIVANICFYFLEVKQFGKDKASCLVDLLVNLHLKFRVILNDYSLIFAVTIDLVVIYVEADRYLMER